MGGHLVHAPLKNEDATGAIRTALDLPPGTTTRQIPICCRQRFKKTATSFFRQNKPWTIPDGVTKLKRFQSAALTSDKQNDMRNYILNVQRTYRVQCIEHRKVSVKDSSTICKITDKSTNRQPKIRLDYIATSRAVLFISTTSDRQCVWVGINRTWVQLPLFHV